VVFRKNYMQKLDNQDEINHRNSLTELPHIKDLSAFVRRIRNELPANYLVPNFDPCDGGINAKILFLFEKPGPMTDSKNGGSGFISRDNNDRTAEATKDFLKMAGLERADTVLWNLIPMWNGIIKIKNNEIDVGIGYLKELLEILKNVKVIVLVGRRSQSAKNRIKTIAIKIDREFNLIESYHPSPKVRSTNIKLWNSIPDEWSKCKNYL
jgi:uracil-DNA glycosylase